VGRGYTTGLLNGFAIGRGRTHSNMDVHDSRDGEDLYRVLRDEVIPLYYQRDRDGLPRGWIKRMKRTIRTLGWRFNADRMVMDYTLKCYIPAAGGHFERDKAGGHVVADDGGGDAIGHQLPGRQPRTLQKRAGFVGVDANVFCPAQPPRE
jgi:hypothetical protein